MYKRQTFYTFSFHLDLGTNQSYQGCIKSCLSDKSHPTPNPCPAWVHFFLGFFKSAYVN